MIDDKTRQKLIQELEKSGNVYLSCLKVGVNRATYYRWREMDSKFKKSANNALRSGRENICDIAEHALLMNVKDKKMDAIKYVLGHLSPKYKPKDKRAFIIHSNVENSEETIALKHKERERYYHDGYSEAMKKFTEEIKLYTDERDTENE